MPIPRVVTRVVARARPRVPDRAWPLLDTLASFVGTGPVVGLPRVGRVLALAAHPDDESAGCAGTLALLAASGADVHVLFATRGEATWGATAPPEEVGRRRAAEAAESCRLLGTRAPAFLGLPDGGLPGREAEIGGLLAEHVRAARPEVVLVPWFLDGHPDHRALSDALEHAGLDPATEVWGYETWTALPPTRLVDVTRVMHLKEASMAAHATALQTFDVTAALGLSRWRSMSGLHGRGHAEAFLALPAPDYVALSHRAGAGR